MSLDDRKNVGERRIVLPEGMYLEGDVVYEFVAGSKPIPVGFVEGEVAYEFVAGGEPIPITGVRY